MYYRDACLVPHGCLGHSGLLLYVTCGRGLCPVNHTAVDLRECQNETGPGNGSDTWLDPGCALLGGGCTRRFAKSNEDKPWCVPVALDEKGLYAPAARVGTTKCRIECGQDYGILDANGSVSCACRPNPSQKPMKEACEAQITEMDPGATTDCFCQSPQPCHTAHCPCIPKKGVMARTMFSRTGVRDVRAAYAFEGLFPVLPCQREEKDNQSRCPANWQQGKIDGYGPMALALGYRFWRPKVGLFYQPVGLPVWAWKRDSCVCMDRCLSDFPTILCLLPAWSPKPLRCVPSTYLDKSLDLRRGLFPVTWKNSKTATIAAANGTTWTCWNNSHDRCEIPARKPLDHAPECVCLRRCTPSLCPCGSRPYRLFKQFEETTLTDGLCTLSGSQGRNFWIARSCEKGPMPCAADERVKHLKRNEKKVFALGYRYHAGGKWLRALPIDRPLRQGECVCIDRCYEGAPFLQCRVTPDSGTDVSICSAPKEFAGLGEGIVLAKNVPGLSCDNSSEGNATISHCDKIECNDLDCNTK